jgi:SAM-dependent methyltransferase
VTFRVHITFEELPKEKSLSIDNKPPTLRITSLRERLKVLLLSGHLKKFPLNERTLDIGCGWGFSLKINPNFYCVDADQACIEHLKSLGARAYLADVSTRLPFEDGFFDNAFTHDVLEHLDQEEMIQLFREARRILRKGGLFMNVVPNRRGYVAGLDPEIGHKRFVTQDEVTGAAAATAFRFERSWSTPLPKPLTELFVHNKLVTVCRAV